MTEQTERKKTGASAEPNTPELSAITMADMAIASDPKSVSANIPSAPKEGPIVRVARRFKERTKATEKSEMLRDKIGARNERLKFTATFCNGIALALITFGVVRILIERSILPQTQTSAAAASGNVVPSTAAPSVPAEALPEVPAEGGSPALPALEGQAPAEPDVMSYSEWISSSFWSYIDPEKVEFWLIICREIWAWAFAGFVFHCLGHVFLARLVKAPEKASKKATKEE